MSRTCYFFACGRFYLPESDGFKWRFFSLLVEFSQLDYEICTDYILLKTSRLPKDLIQPEDAVIILADTRDANYRTRMDALTEYARKRGVEPRYCLAP